MASLEPFVLKIKPAIDAFLRNADKESLRTLENELSQFRWTYMSIFNIQILVPLVLKLEELSNDNQDLRAGCLQCITLVTSKVYLRELTAIRTMLVIAIKQVREIDKAAMRPNLSEELKLATVKCIAECFKRSTTDVLEQFYTKNSAMILGQILLTLVEFIEKDKYKKLVLSSLECLMIVFYVHDEADRMDIVLRNQVANTIFIFLPKIVTLLHQISLGNETIGETIKYISIKAIGRILCVIYEDTSENLTHAKYDVASFTKLLSKSLIPTNDSKNDNDILAIKRNREQLEHRMTQLQEDGRTEEWIQATSKKLRIIFTQISKLRSHSSTKIRQKYAEMCCILLENCCHNLKENVAIMLESVLSLMEDENIHIRDICHKCVNKLQNKCNDGMFDENCELLLEQHLMKLPRIIARCDDDEQYIALTFFKGLLRIMSSSSKLVPFLSITHNLDMFCMCLLSAADLQRSTNLLIEEYSLREMVVEVDYLESRKLPWRKYKNLNSERSVQCLQEICCILGKTPVLNRIIVDYLLELLQNENPAMNEILLMLVWLVTAEEIDNQYECQGLKLVKQLLDEILDDKHWHLALEPDKVTKLAVNRHSDWFADHTPGLYESAVEIRTQDCVSDDETESSIENIKKVSIADAEFNVLHTCIILDCLGHCAFYLGERFDGYVFQSLHKVLLKLAHSNSLVYKAANFSLVAIQKSLRFYKATQLIETHIDYITYHLNRLLKKTPEDKSAVDILSMVLQFSSRKKLSHLEIIFDTIYEESAKQYGTHNALPYLRVFNAFLKYITSWLLSCNTEIKDGQKMDIDNDDSKNFLNDSNILNSWLDILNNSTTINEIINEDVTMKSTENVNAKPMYEYSTKENAVEENDEQLPQYIRLVKSILKQAIKYLSACELHIQISSLECLTYGIPLLHGYENELLPLVHAMWPPLVEKFRQKKYLVLNRCFSLLEVLAVNAKDFITRKCLDDVMPFLKQFLEQAATHSRTETISVPTQEYKLQVKLLKEFPSIIECLDLDGKHLCEISEIVAVYLNEEQPKELQSHAVEYFQKLLRYNGPLIYLVAVKKSHLKLYQNNVNTILKSFVSEVN